MRPLRGLLVDDEPKNLPVIEETLDLEFEAFDWRVGWSRCSGAREARPMIRKGDVFDFAIIDLYLEENEQDGLAVVKELHLRDPRSFILVVTSHQERNPAFAEEARQAGATHAIVRRELFSTSRRWEFGMLAQRIRDHLASVGLITLGTVAFDENDPGILSVLEGLGREPSEAIRYERGLRIVRNLAMRCLETQYSPEASFELSYLAPGRSGAQICRVDLSLPKRPVESFVLKFGLDKNALDAERLANIEASRVLGQQTLISIIGEVQTDSSGYHAIAAKVAESARPLAQWIGNAKQVEARAIAQILFGEQLAALFRQELRQSRPIAQWMQCSSLYRLRVENALARLREAAEHPSAGSLHDVDERWTTVRNFVRTGALPIKAPGRIATNTIYTKSFGDLHSSNVLVQVGKQCRPVLVDASMYGEGHWGLDCARLLVDLFLRVRASDVRSMLWTDLTGSISSCVRLCPIERSAVSPIDPTEAFIDEVVGDLENYLQFESLGLLTDQWHWQWHVALAKELLRQIVHPDLTPARRVLAISSAAEHIRIAGGLIDALSF